jgi:hypothetical protein
LDLHVDFPDPCPSPADIQAELIRITEHRALFAAEFKKMCVSPDAERAQRFKNWRGTCQTENEGRPNQKVQSSDNHRVNPTFWSDWNSKVDKEKFTPISFPSRDELLQC